MSLIDRPPSTGKRLKRMFINSKSNTLSKRNGSGVMPGSGRELSLSKQGINDISNERCIRVFRKNSDLITSSHIIYAKDSTNVKECISILIKQIPELSNGDLNNYSIFECIGRLDKEEKLDSLFDTYESLSGLNTDFNEINSRQLLHSQSIMEVFSIMTPAPGLVRRLELRNNNTDAPQTKTIVEQSNIVLQKSNNVTDTLKDGNKHIVKQYDTQCKAPKSPHFLLIKGSRPEKDLLILNLHSIYSGSKPQLTIGNNKKDDLCLYCVPDSQKSMKSQQNNAVISLFVNSSSGLKGTEEKNLWIEISADWNITLPLTRISVTVNWERLTEKKRLPIRHCLQPGDIIRFEAQNLSYIYIFKNADTVPEHHLSLGCLILPNSPTTPNPICGNSSRSASRTARIAAASDSAKGINSYKHSSVSSTTENCETTRYDNFLPSPDEIEGIVKILFSKPAETNEYGIDNTVRNSNGMLIDVSVAAASFAHLLQSIVRASERNWQQNQYEFYEQGGKSLKLMESSLTNELEQFNSVSDEHIITAIWRAAFCFYLGNYLSLKCEKYQKPSNKSNDLEYPNESSDCEGSYNNAIVSLSDKEEFKNDSNKHNILNSIRESVFSEAEITLTEAVQLVLMDIVGDLVSICQLVASSRSNETDTNTTSKSKELLEKLDKFRSSLRNTLTGKPIPSPEIVVHVTKAKEYNDRPKIRQKINDSLGSSEIDDDDDENTNSDAITSLSMSSEGKHKSNKTKDLTNNKSVLDIKEETKICPALLRIEEVFFRRLLVEISTCLISQFLENPKLTINCQTGVQLLTLVHKIYEWMKNSGVERYAGPLELIAEFSRLMATPKEKLFQLTRYQMYEMYTDLPSALLNFILDGYENGTGCRQAPRWVENVYEQNDNDESPFECLIDYSKNWLQTERLFAAKRSQTSTRLNNICKPMELVTLFQLDSTLNVLQHMDRMIAEKKLNFRWTMFLKHFPPLQINNVKNTNGEFVEPAVQLRARSKNVSTSKVYSKKIDPVKKNLPNVILNRPNTLNYFEYPEPEPILSAGNPRKSLTVSPFMDSNCSRSEINGYTSRKKFPGNAATSYFLSSGGYYQLGCSNPQLYPKKEFLKNCQTSRLNDATILRLREFNNTNNYLAKSFDFNTPEFRKEIKQEQDSWHQFKQENSQSGSLLYITNVNNKNGTSLINGNTRKYSKGQKKRAASESQFMSQSYHDEPTGNGLPDFLINNLNVSGSQTMKYPSTLHNISQQNFSFRSYSRMSNASSFANCSLIGIENTCQVGSSVFNVVIDKLPDESIGIRIIEGHTTHLDKPGIYITHVVSNSPADLCRKIFIGDRIFAIDGTDVNGLTYKDCCLLLKQNKSRITFTIHKESLENAEYLLRPRKQ